jgi:cytochrome c oxidase assembly protein subunit 15
MFRRLARLGAALAVIVVVVGAWVRLTQAGLGCPDWPGCYGHITPAAVLDQLADATAAFPNRPFEYQKALHEMVHRYIATGLGAVIIALVGLSVWNRRQPGQPRYLPWVLLGLVCAQGALGALTVTLLLKPIIVTLHLMGGLTTLAILYWLSLPPEPPTALAPGLKRLVLLALALLGMQVMLGGWTSANYAAIACPDFPTCQGSFVPTTDFSNGFALRHVSGTDYQGGILSVPARTAIHYTHRIGAVLVASLFAVLILVLWRSRATPRIKHAALVMGAAVLLQWLIAVNFIWRGFPLWLGTAHNAGAVFLLLCTVTLLRRVWPTRP